MRDTNDFTRTGNVSDKSLFEKFKGELRGLLKENGYELKYEFCNQIGIPYKGGFLEVYEYDRPSNPRFKDGYLEFDWYLVGELRVIKIELV